MAAKTNPEPMMTLGELRQRVQVIWPRPQEFLRRFAGVDPDKVVQYDSVTGQLAVPVDIARAAIEAYESERTEGVRLQREYEKYRKEQAEKAKQERIAAAKKEGEKRADLTERNAEKARKARAEAARRNAPAESPRRAKEREVQGDPLSPADWLKKKGER